MFKRGFKQRNLYYMALLFSNSKSVILLIRFRILAICATGVREKLSVACLLTDDKYSRSQICVFCLSWNCKYLKRNCHNMLVKILVTKLIADYPRWVARILTLAAYQTWDLRTYMYIGRSAQTEQTMFEYGFLINGRSYSGYKLGYSTLCLNFMLPPELD